MKYVLQIVFILLLLKGFSQKTCSLQIKPVVGGVELTESQYQFTTKDNAGIINELRFYISKISFHNEGVLVWEDKELAHLIDIKDSSSKNINFTLENDLVYDEIQFNLGIDSLLNTSGALSGDLDPTKGMYWSWQSGYINMKLEGITTNDVKFQYHIGGYQVPFNPIQSFSFPLNRQKGEFELVLDLELLLWNIDFNKDFKIMRPCKKAVDFSKELQKAIYLNE